MKFNCAYCGQEADKPKGAVVRAQKAGLNIYCSREHAGLGRRVERTPKDKKKLKEDYDRKRRAELADRIKAEKAEYHKKTYNPEQAAIKRKERMPKHIEYCRRPEYKAWKQQYDMVHRMKKEYGEYWESARILVELEKEIDVREAKFLNNIYNKSQKRKRLWQTKNFQQKI